MVVQEGQKLWEPSTAFVNDSAVSHYIEWLKDRQIITCKNYHELFDWSVSETELFWASLWDYFDIISDSPFDRVVDTLEMKPGVKWFEGSRVNFAEHILRNEKPNTIALYYLSEHQALQSMSWTEFAAKVRILATAMRKEGLKPGDAVCCLMPNIPETVIAMLAAISIGAVWSNAAPEFGVNTILDRFKQIEPKWLFVADGYQFNGKPFDRKNEVSAIISELNSSVEKVVYLPYLNPEDTDAFNNTILLTDLFQGEDPGAENFNFERVPYDHPLWILFSSGTTGLPKAIVHSHVGVLIELMKLSTFHMDLSQGDVSLFYTTTGWVMFNLQVSFMLTGACAVFYDGSPTYPQPDILWKIAAQTKANLFGASPTYVQQMASLGIKPADHYDFKHLKSILCTGSPTSPETFEWFYKNVKEDLWLTSQSGGTEIVSGFVGASPTLPVYAGEIQTRILGMDVASLNEHGESLTDEVGELVCRKPFPSMPIYFLNDPGNQRYLDSYFNLFKGVWSHGDFIKFNQRGGAYIYGRSDSTLNRYGIRIGTSEVYRALEKLPEIADSLVVCIELPGGAFFMPMFLSLSGNQQLNDELEAKIRNTLKTECSPRHIPDKFYQTQDIPYTLTGKKQEIPIRKLLLGWPMEKAINLDTMKNPESINYFIDFVATTTDYEVPK